MSKFALRTAKTHTLIGVISLAMVGQWLYEARAAAELPDPTRPPLFTTARVRAAAPAKPQLVLQLTLISPDRQIAMINGQTYPLGASIEGAVITQIRPYEVTLRRSGRETRLRFFPRLIDDNFADKGRSDAKAR